MSKELLPRSNAEVGYKNIELNNQKHKLKHKNHWRNLKLKSLSAVIEKVYCYSVEVISKHI